MRQKSMGVDRNIAGLLAYALGWISGLVVILVEKNDDLVRFHAMQSILVFGGLTVLNLVLGTVLGFFLFLIPFLNLLGVVLWILLMVKAYQGEQYKLPVIGDLAEEWSRKVDL